MAAQVGVPGVAVGEVAALGFRGHCEVDGHGLKGGGLGLGLAKPLPRFVALDTWFVAG